MISFAEFLFEGPYTQAMLSKLQGNSIRKTPSGAKASQGKQGRQRDFTGRNKAHARVGNFSHTKRLGRSYKSFRDKRIKLNHDNKNTANAEKDFKKDIKVWTHLDKVQGNKHQSHLNYLAKHPTGSVQVYHGGHKLIQNRSQSLIGQHFNTPKSRGRNLIKKFAGRKLLHNYQSRNDSPKAI